MTAMTTGIEVRSRSRWLRDAVELVSSMRFSISLLTVICIASVIGTIVSQHEPFSNYVNKFGPFWAQLFAAVGLDTVYSVWWFLLILAFLVISTSLCIARNTPKILHDLRTYKENLREQSLAAFHHKGSAEVAQDSEATYARVATLLVDEGWRAKVEQRREADGTLRGTMIAARRGTTNRLGYLAAHSAIVLICIGGLFDGDLIVRAQMLLQGKTPYFGDGFIKDVPPQHWLSPNNPTFRGQLPVVEGARVGTARLTLGDGLLLQPLPFDVELKKFIVDYYATGMPKLFASEIVIHDRDTGAAIPATVKVNEPVFHRGVAIYQSSFDDGGSALKLRAIPLTPGGHAFDINGAVGGTTELSNGANKLTLEFTGLRVINVENLGGDSKDGGTDVRKVDLGSLADHLGAGNKVRSKRELRNVGPSVSYKLRDAAGQAREFNNYMLPIELDGQRVFLAGTRDKPDEAMRYLRIPADDQDSIAGWVRLREALLDPAMREKAASRYVALATPADKPQMAQQLQVTALRALGLFAGADAVKGSRADGKPPGGLQAISDFIETSVPAPDRGRISEVLLRILNGSLFELLNATRENAGLAPLKPDEKTQAFMTQSVLSLSDSFFYPAPVLLELTDFKQVQQSVFQVAKAPGKILVYIGAVLLIVGVFAMLYIRERRLWVWIAPLGADAGNGTKIATALSTTRRTLDIDAEFERLKRAILGEGAAA
ncbi:MAG TPA: cytochrome c biogenesis protein ResB [Burkholderiaceae bacterium]|nr:cytochrome c biogenesis protein ResB [Burkholderiaceae bacterium]